VNSPRLILLPLLLSACFLSAFAQPAAPDSSKLFHFFLPEKSWALELDLHGFQPPDLDFAPDLRSAKLTARHPKSGFMVTAQINPARNNRPTTAERDGMIKRLRKDGFDLLDLKTYERDGRAYLEYTIKGSPKIPAPAGFQQRNVFVFMAQDGAWVDVHVSKTNFTASDAAGLDAFVRTAAVIDTFQPASMDYYLPGSVLYRRDNYEGAIIWLSRALEEEKKKPILSHDQRLILIEKLGVAHGMTGHLRQARAVLAYGLAQDPEFPMFYYNIACIDAEDGDLASALENLRLTLQHRANMIPGETWPDPIKDSSFKAYVKDSRFQEVAKAFRRP